MEDSELQREICIFQLNELGFDNVTGMADGRAAYEWLEANPVDLIISDLEMPVLNGMELLAKVRANDRLQDIPFVMLTVSDDEVRLREIVCLGVTDYIVKPSTPQVLKVMLERVFFG